MFCKEKAANSGIHSLKSYTNIILFLLTCGISFAQNPLNQKITVDLQDKNLEQALDEIADAGGFTFSYNSDLIEVDRRIAVNSSNRPVKAVLNEVLGQKMNYKVRGSYVIIQAPKQNKPKQKFKISGEIKDSKTGEKIEDVTVYEVDKLKSTLSGKDGKYDFTVSRKAEFVNVAISKKNYRDTVIQVSKLNPLPPIINLTPLKSIDANAQSSVDSAELVKFFVPARLSKTADNVQLRERRRLQISFLPFAGTNRLMSGKISNDLSINILAGYSRSVEVGEIGGFLNIVREDVTGFQVAGMGNFVGNEMNGIQAAGFFNMNGGKVQGIQASGFANLAIDTVAGWQITGFVNLAKMTDAAQLSGFTNIAWQKSKKLQVTGFGNYTKDSDGMQIAGLTNIAVGKMNGGQIGILNYAGDVGGFQLGIVNVADTVSSGINIGLISYVKNGLHKLEYARNDAMQNNLSFKTGTYKFYNILTGGFRPQDEGHLWSFGYGIGTQKNFKNDFTVNLELTANSIQKGRNLFIETNFLGEANINLGYRFNKYFSINAGPVLYTYLSDSINQENGEFGLGIATNPFRNELINDIDFSGALKMWVGWQTAVMF